LTLAFRDAALRTNGRRSSVVAELILATSQGTNWPALAAAIGGSIVGAAGVAFGWLNSRGERTQAQTLAKGERTHARTLARETRLYEDVKHAYIDVLTFLDAMRDVLNRTEPIIGPQPDPPPLPSEDEARGLYARVAVVGSNAVIDELDALAAIQREFFARVHTVQIIREQRAPRETRSSN
jgi:hypothetical protein